MKETGKYLDRALYQYGKGQTYPFHMPGHKRQAVTPYLTDPWKEDITEITGFDNLHHAEGILKEAQEYAARIFRAEQTWFLINGSTAGILAAVSACTSPGGKILMARNCHKAVYHAAYLRKLETIYLYPSREVELGLNGGISPKEVETALEQHRDVQAVVITSPTYDGILSDVKGIAQAAHRHGVPLIVDEAHGAHLPFHERFPRSALYLGADLVIQSLHKTLPSLTQTAVLHRQSEMVPEEKLDRFLGIYQTSSPSYVLMASMAACLRYLEEEGKQAFDRYVFRLEQCRERLGQMKNLYLPDREICGQGNIFDLDLSKILVSGAGTGIEGPVLHRILREKYGLEMEMEAPGYVLALTSVMDTEEGLERLIQALEGIDTVLDQENGAKNGIHGKIIPSFEKYPEKLRPRQKMSIAQAMEAELEERDLERSAEEISGEFAYLYPPGIPLLAPGEVISREFIKRAGRWQEQGLELQGLADHSLKKIRIVKGK